MRTSIWLGIGVCLWTQAVWGQRPVTSIASPVDLTGQTVTVPVRVMNAPRGAASLSSVTLYLKSDAGLEAEFWVSVDFGSGALQVFDNFTTPGAPRYASYPPPTVAVGSRTGLNWGFAGLLEISGYTLAKTGNEVALDLTIKRFAPYTGMKHFTLAAGDETAGADQYSSPWSWVSAGTWNYVPATSSSWTVAPAALNVPAGGHKTVAVITGSLAAPPVVTPSAAWLRVVGAPAVSGFSLEVDANTGATARVGQFSVSDGVSGPRVVSVTQAGAVEQRPVTSLAVTSLTGTQVTVPIRVLSANGATAPDGVTLYVKSDAGAAAEFWVSVNLVTREIQILDAFTAPAAPRYAHYPPQMLTRGGTETGLSWGFPGLFEITGYEFADPNTTGNELRLNLTMKRYAPYTGTKAFTLAATDPLAGTLLYSAPWSWVSAGDWAYAAGPAADFTVPTTLSAATVSGAAGYVDLTLTPVGAPPGLVTLTTAEAGVTFTPLSVTLSTMAAQTVRVNLPARTASYGFTVSAQAGSNPAKTVGVNVTVAAPSITLTLGAQTPSPAFATTGTTLRVNIAPTAWTGSVLVTCSSGAAGVSCPGRYVNVTAGVSTPVDLAVDTTTATPNGAALSVTATPQGVGAPVARTVNGTLSMATGLTLRAPSPLPVLFTGSPMSFSLLVVPSGGYTGAVNVTCSGIAGVSCVGAGNVVDGNPVAVAVLVSGATGGVVGARTLTMAAGAWQTGPVPVEVVLATLPVLENPTPGTGLLRAGASVTFRWFAGTGATGYRIQVRDDQTLGEVMDATTNNLYAESVRVVPPALGACSGGGCTYFGNPLFDKWRVKLTAYNGDRVIGTTAEWVVPIAAPVAPMELTQPPNGSTLSATTFFVWPVSALPWRLKVGTLGLGSEDLRPGVATTGGSGVVRLDGVPTNRLVYATLETLVDGAWLAKNYIYNGSVVSGGGGGGGGGTPTVTLSTKSTLTPPQIPLGGQTTWLVKLTVDRTTGLVLKCAGSFGISCGPSSLSSSAAGSYELPIIIRAAAGASVNPADGLRIDAEAVSQPGVVLASTSLPIGVAPAESTQAPRAEAQPTVAVYADGNPKTIPVTMDSGGDVSHVKEPCSTTPSADVTVRLGAKRPATRGFDLIVTATESARTGLRYVACTYERVGGSLISYPITGTIAVFDRTPQLTSITTPITATNGTRDVTLIGRYFGFAPRLVFEPSLDYGLLSVSATQITARLGAPQPGSYAVAVASSGNNFTLGYISAGSTGNASSLSGELILTVNPSTEVPAPVPVIYSVDPQRISRGGRAEVQVTGRNLGALTGMAISGGGIQCDFVGSDEFSASLGCLVEADATVGQRNITLTNQFGTSNPGLVDVEDPAPSVSSITPDVWDKGASTDVVIRGRGFGPNATVSVGGGIDIVLKSVSEDQIVATAAVPSDAAPDVRDLVVTSAGMSGLGFQSTSGQSAESNAAPIRLAAPPPARVQVTNVGYGGSPCQAKPVRYDVSAGEAVCITPEPQMPALRARLLPQAGNLTGTVTWRLVITHQNRRIRCKEGVNGPCDPAATNPDAKWKFSPISTTFAPATTLAADAEWDIGAAFGASFRGGTAILFWKLNGDAERSFSFKVAGANPETPAVLNFAGETPWFIRAVFRSESGSGLNQFNRLGDSLWGLPEGYGVGQLDPPCQNSNCPLFPATVQAGNRDENLLWNWNANVLRARAIGHEKRDTAGRTFAQDATRYREFILAGGFSPAPGPFVEPPTSVDGQEKCIFTLFPDPAARNSEGLLNEHHLIDASTIKLYQGGFYLRWSITFARWVITPINVIGNIRVRKVGKVCEWVRQADFVSDDLIAP